MNTQLSAPVEEPEALVARLRTTFRSGRTVPLNWRTEQLRKLRALLDENREEFAAALHHDLGKSRTEAFLTEVDFTIQEIDHTLKHLEDWLTPQPVDAGPAFATISAHVSAQTRYEPLGAVLVIAPWNFPVQLLLVPIIGALAAGNTVVAKPSEIAPATSALIARLFPQYLDRDAVAVVEGAVPETTALLAQCWDHIFYTGNGVVGRIVMRAAAENLTPVTLELGGKSPAFVDRDADLAETAQHLAETKFLNAGQVCVAPDYVLTDPDTARALIGELRQAITRLFGDDPEKSERYGRIVNERHFDRVSRLFEGCEVAIGGETDRAQKYIAPTVLTAVSTDAPAMAEEIFGPLLPIVEVADLQEAIDFINDRAKPLALYAFTGNDETRRRLAADTSSGGLVFGLPIAHLRVSELPFGGVGESGMGSYHGPHSIATFSHRKAVLDVTIIR